MLEWNNPLDSLPAGLSVGIKMGSYCRVRLIHLFPSLAVSRAGHTFRILSPNVYMIIDYTDNSLQNTYLGT